MSNPDTTELLETIRRYCSDSVGIPLEEVLPHSDLREDLGMSLVEIGQVLSRLQTTYDFLIPPADLKMVVRDLTTVNSVLELVGDELEL